MKTVRPLKLAAFVSSLLLFALVSTAHAEYVWIDKKNVRNYSDWSPPSNTPKDRILKVPKTSSWSEELYKEEAEAPPAQDETSESPSIAHREAEYKKRKLEQAEKEKEAAEAKKLTKETARRCTRAREYQRTLQSGIRITRMDKNGQRSFMTDKQRAQELSEIRRVLADCP